jgi:hypothetical protein
MINCILFLILSFGQVRAKAENFPQWTKQPTAPKVSAEWRLEKASVDADLARLRKLPKERRKVEFMTLLTKIKVQQRSHSGRVDPKLVYRAARFGHAFDELELREKPEIPVFEYACGYPPGSPDPEFRRAVYVYWCFDWSPGYWPGMGQALLKVFPEDKELKEAFIKNARSGGLAYDDLILAERIFDQYNAFGYPQAEALMYKAAFYLGRFGWKQLKSDMDKAIAYYAQVLKTEHDKTTERWKIAQSWHDALVKGRAAGKYKSG